MVFEQNKITNTIKILEIFEVLQTLLTQELGMMRFRLGPGRK